MVATCSWATTSAGGYSAFTTASTSRRSGCAVRAADGSAPSAASRSTSRATAAGAGLRSQRRLRPLLRRSRAWARQAPHELGQLRGVVGQRRDRGRGELRLRSRCLQQSRPALHAHRKEPQDPRQGQGEDAAGARGSSSPTAPSIASSELTTTGPGRPACQAQGPRQAPGHPARRDHRDLPACLHAGHVGRRERRHRRRPHHELPVEGDDHRLHDRPARIAHRGQGDARRAQARRLRHRRRDHHRDGARWGCRYGRDQLAVPLIPAARV
jgi:hypothetical protein